jgi:hypothetical protein
VDYALPIVVYLLPIGALYFFIGRKRTQGEGAAFLLLLAAAAPVTAGGVALFREFDLQQHPRVVSGVIVEKLSSTGENGTRTIGGGRRWRAGHRLPTVLTSKGFELYDELARLMLTGSMDAWVVDYRHACGAHTCWKRDFVSHALWSDLRAGQAVNVLTSTNPSSGRLENNSRWGTALAKLAMGCTLLMVAAVVSGRWQLRRQRFVTVPAVVTSIERSGPGQAWRVGFAYFSADGTARESVDEVYVSGVRPGDNCSVVYPENQPELGILRLAERLRAG